MEEKNFVRMGVRDYRKKPVVIKALQWLGASTMEEAQRFIGAAGIIKGDHIDVSTFEGIMTASPGDFIIQGVAGEFYPCKPEIFEKTYEEVTNG